MKSFHLQNGVALITALLIVALATILTVGMTTRQQLDIRRTANLINSEQAYMYALGGENWTKRILLRDAKDNKINKTSIPPWPILGGTLEGQIEELQGRFNLNNLIHENQVSIEDMRIFERLLQNLELPPKLAQVIVDWIDSDMEPQLPFGAEDNTYLIKKRAYRTANTIFRSPTEILLLNGFNHDNYQILLPHITTLPTRTPININTTTGPILKALVEELSDLEAEALTDDIKKEPFKSVHDFIMHEALARLKKPEIKNLSVSSDYFLLSVQVTIDKRQIQLNSILHRLPDKIEVVMRSQGLSDYTLNTQNLNLPQFLK